MASFSIPQLKALLPILKECYGFDETEILCELTESLQPYIDERRMDEIVQKQRTKGKKRILLLDYAINLEDYVEISTTDDFDKQIDSINGLCDQSIEDDDMRNTAKFILTFMAAIFDREIEDKHSDDITKRFRKSWNIVHPDLLELFITLNKPRHKHDTPIKFYFKGESHHTINNREGWFSDLLNGFVKQVLGDITIEQAELELKQYSDDRGRKSNNPYLNYIINGTYNFITHLIKSENCKVTVEQCRFLLEYLKITGLVKHGDTLHELNTLQSAVKSLISSNFTPVDKHIREAKKFPF